MKRLNKADQAELAAAFADFAMAAQRIADALGWEDEDEEPSESVRSGVTSRARQSGRSPSIMSHVAPEAAEAAAVVSHGKSSRKILVALAQLGRPLTRQQVAFFACLSHGAGSFNSALAGLRAARHIDGPGSAISITPLGLRELGDFKPLPQGHQLFEFWCHKMGGSAEKILRVLRPESRGLSRDEVAERAELSAGAGSFNSALAALRKMQLIQRGTPIQLTEEFRKAIAPSVRVFDRSSGQETRHGLDGTTR